MAMFKEAATLQLKLLTLVFLMASSSRVLPPKNPAAANGCARELYLRLDLAHDRLVLTALAAAMLFLGVRMAVDAAEHNFVAAARAAAAKTFDADDEALAADVDGIGIIGTRWKRLSLRALLLLAVGLSLAASFLAVVVVEDGFVYRTGACADVDAAGTGSRSPVAVALMALVVVEHGVFAWAAVCED